MKKPIFKIRKASAILYALIISAFAVVLIILASASVLTGSIINSQTIDGIQAYYASESAMELAYTTRRYLAGGSIPSVTHNPQSADTLRTSIENNINTDLQSIQDPIIFIPINAQVFPARRNLNTITMEFKIYEIQPYEQDQTTITNRNFTLMCNGYYGSSQYNLKSFIGAPNDPFLPYILNSSE
ncbi:MAG: hypothetical protein ABH837_00690 [bacterium]